MLNKFLRTPIATVALFALAAVLIGFGGVRGVAAAPSVQTERDYGAEIELASIKTSVTEFGAETDAILGDAFLSENGIAAIKDFQVGKTYNDVVAVKNTGEIPQYVRVTVRCYWVDGEGKSIETTKLDPSLIQLGFTKSGWTLDEAASTDERQVWYYGSVVAPGASTNALFDSITIDDAVLTAMKDGGYAYEGVSFKVEVTADAVQDHNAEDAQKSAWGQTI